MGFRVHTAAEVSRPAILQNYPGTSRATRIIEYASKDPGPMNTVTGHVRPARSASVKTRPETPQA